MKKRGVAGFGLAAVGLLLLSIVAGRNILGADFQPDTDSGGATKGTVAATAGPGRGFNAKSSRRAMVQLPEVDDKGSRPLPLTRAMLEQAWQDGELSVLLPDGQRYSVALETQRLDPGAQWTVVGRVQTRVGPQAMVLTIGPEAVFGVLPRPDGSLLQITTTRGRTGVAVAGGLLPPGTPSMRSAEPDYLLVSATSGAPGDGGRSTRQLEAHALDTSSAVEISVLALYDDELVELRGSASAAETEVTNLFAISQQAHLDSGTRVRLVLAGLERITIDPTLNNHDILYSLTDNTVPDVDLVHMRDDAAADLVALVRPHREEYGTCGLAWLNGSGRAPQNLMDNYGFSVSNVAPCGPYVLAHELAHNMGSAHDRETDSISGHLEYGAYRYSFGYRQDGPPAFATVMAYSVGQPWVGYFSNPDSRACGTACGIEDREDNVRSLNQIAPVVAAFRGPPGTLSIVDAEINEVESGDYTSLLYQVRLSGPAPAGGVQFDVAVSGGSAQPGVDYLVPDPTGYVIAEGERNTLVHVSVVGDNEKEPDESIHLSLANVVGATVHDGEAVGMILNDDPRLTLTGRIRFEEGVSPPDTTFWMYVTEQSDFNHTVGVKLSPPDFSYELAVVEGANLEFVMEPPPPFAILPFTMSEITASRVRDITLKKGFHVSGQIRLPAGQPALVDPLHLDIRSSIDGVYQSLPYTALEAPDFRYSHWVVPGAWLYVAVQPPPPFKPFFAVHNDVHSDIAQDIELSQLPSLVIWGGGRLTEGFPDTSGSLDFIVQLSAPAPPGGVQLRYRSVDGTATAGSDYTAVKGTLEIPEGEMFTSTDQIAWFGDTEVEGDEHFFVEVSDVVGANPVVTSQRVTLYEWNPRMSDPLPAQQR